MICINSFIIIISSISFILLPYALYKKICRLKRRARRKSSRHNPITSHNDLSDKLDDSGDTELGDSSHAKLDDFHSGRFHFEKKVKSDNLSKIKYALAQNDQDSLHEFLMKIDGATDIPKIKTKKISNDVITIGFFCTYMNAGFFRKTIGAYNEIYEKIRWVGCLINADHIVTGSSCPIISFSDTKSAVSYADQYFDFIVDADCFLRPDNFYEVIKNTSCYVLNYYNLSCSTYNNHFDVAFVPEDLELSKYPPSEKTIIKMPVLGSWNMSEQTKFYFRYIYDIAFIGHQFKYGKKFLTLYKDFSFEFKIVFLGLEDVKYFSKHLKEAGWNMKNIEFHNRIDNGDDFRYFLTKTKVVIDTPDYSGGSSNVYALRSGTPVLTLNGKYLVDGMISSVLKEMGLGELCFDDTEGMKNFLNSKTSSEFKKYSKYIAKKTSDSMQFKPEKFLAVLHEKLLEHFGKK